MTGSPSSSTERHAPLSPRRGLLKVTVTVLILAGLGFAAYRHESAPLTAPDAGAAPVGSAVRVAVDIRTPRFGGSPFRVR